MRRIRAAATGAVFLSLARAASAGGGGSSTGGGSDDSPGKLTYWASGQGAGLKADKKVLQPGLGTFEKRPASRSSGRSFPGPTCSTASSSPPPPARARTC